ncbi:probable glucosamine 6-phosphate N-acetyltransferase isoform X2 [Odontomachus brunneus]|uniref:probable glucosamine 6-phosphate N-acetyltransferase isoform X2 n=1 Tax=Odontomachus brunneus TaxID=486640 RepID=UPI0013F25057|nr:probable glucosamine 6-phosphate N-acetyltransferase isoform X2 [Odontomachus brunneus]
MSKVQEKFLKKDEINLFNPTILEKLSLPATDGLLIRPLKSTDHEKGYLVLLSQLTDVGNNITKDQFLKDIYTGKIIGCATLLVEQKFIHNCGLRGRLEDVVVDNNYRGKSLGKLVVTIIVQLSRYFHCYKLSLDCTDRLVPFYENIGFKREPNNANHLNMRFPGDNVTEQSHL